MNKDDKKQDPCPACVGGGGAKKKDCPICKGRGWVYAVKGKFPERNVPIVARIGGKAGDKNDNQQPSSSV